MRLSEEEAWTVAEELDVDGFDIEPLREPLAPLLLAILENRPPSELERISRRTARKIWNDELAQETRTSLHVLRALLMLRLRHVDAALSELERPVERNRMARATIDRLAMELVREAEAETFQLAAVEEELRNASPAERRAVVLPLSGAVAGNVGIDPHEAGEAAARFLESFPDEWSARPAAADHAAHWLARTLATDERRARMRAELAELAQAASGLPLLAAELEGLLDEPVAEDAAEDDLWVNLVVALAGTPALAV